MTYATSTNATPTSVHGPTTGSVSGTSIRGDAPPRVDDEPAQSSAAASSAWRAWSIPSFVLALLLAVYLIATKPVGVAVAYTAMALMPFLTGCACFWRARAESVGTGRVAWAAIGITMVLWSLGALDNLWQELILGHANEMYRNAMLAFNISAVPLVFLLAGEWETRGRRIARAFDAVIALALGYGYFLIVWAMLTARGAPDEAGVAALVRLLDIQNFFIFTLACVRWRAAADANERATFRVLTLYGLTYFMIVTVNNRWIAPNPNWDARESSVIVIAFAFLWVCARHRSASLPAVRARAQFTRIVRIVSPMVPAGALLLLSLVLIRIDYVAGVVGVLIAVLGYGARSVVAQVRHIEREDSLQRDKNELRAIAWTDALTGVANRRFADDALQRIAKVRSHERRETSSYAVLMVDLDHFKGLNDHYGHAAGDSCLRIVARTMQHALARPGDVLARYGGEEFIVLLRDADQSGACIVAERLRAAVQALGIDHAQSPFRVVTVSIGVACSPVNDGHPVTKVVEAADRELYNAKCAGRNQIASG